MHGRKQPAILAASAVCACLISWLLSAPLKERFLSGRNDFPQFHAGARLAGTPDLYTIEASRRIQMEVAGEWFPSVYWTRPAWYAVVLSPLARLSYRSAYAVWISIQVLTIGLWLAAAYRQWTPLLLLASCSLPLYLSIANGQDTGLLTALAALAIALIRRGRMTLAGAVFSFCSIKPHLLVLVPVVLLVHRRWNVLAGGVAGGALLWILSSLGAGWDWPVLFFRMAANPELHPYADRMTTSYGMLTLLGIPSIPLELAIAAAVAAWMAWFSLRQKLETSLALALIAGGWIAHHAYLADTLLLLLAVQVLFAANCRRELLGLCILAASPITAIAVLSGAPFSGFFHIVLLLILAAASFLPPSGAASTRPARID